LNATIGGRCNARGDPLEILSTIVVLNEIIDCHLAIVEPNEVFNINSTVSGGMFLICKARGSTESRHEDN
jgi:hypothetical protein